MRRLLLAVGACGTAVGLGILAVFPPTEFSFYPKCPLHQMSGLHCPGCGLTRGLHSLLNGDVKQAIAYNGIGLVLLAVGSVQMARSIWAWASDARLDTARHTPKWLAWGIGSFLILYGVARNLPFEPFTALAPHELKPPPSAEKKVAVEELSS
jgi:hypothetical protein